MKRTTPLLALLLAIAMPVSVIAQPRVIGDLTQGALLGEIRDTAQLQDDFSKQHALLAQAGTRLGLSKADFGEVQDDIAHGRARYVEIPRRLDGMAGAHDGRAFAVHDVVIPPHVYGWEVDLERQDRLVRVFMPNRCGNMSYLIVPRRQILAAAMPYHLSTPAPKTVAPAAQPAAPVIAAEAAPTPQPVAFAPVAPVTPAVVAPAAHHFALLPWLALGLIGVALMHGGGGSIGTGPVPAAPVPTPAPLHTICPTAAVHR